MSVQNFDVDHLVFWATTVLSALGALLLPLAT
jgi:hypothetical protein